MFTSEDKNSVAQEILNILIKLLEENKITDEEGREMAQVATFEIENAKNEFDLPQIYANLSQRWPIFQQNATIEFGKVDIKQETEVAKGVEELIRAGKLDSALLLARTETQEQKQE